MLDWIGQHWNDVLTIALVGVALLSLYYQVKHYRAQFSEVKILEVKNAEHRKKEFSHADLFTRDFPDTVTSYSMDLSVENDGREPATITGIKLILPSTDEELKMKFKEAGFENWSSSINLTENDHRGIRCAVNGEGLQEDSTNDVEGIIHLNTTTGDVEESVTFSSLDIPQPDEHDTGGDE